MATGAVNASVTGTVYTDSKLAIYQVDKVLLPLDLVLPAKAPALAPAPALAKGLPKAGKTNSSALDDGSGAGSDDGDTKDLPAEASGAVSLMMWVNAVVGMGLAAGLVL
jgi:hypothetical protein